MAQLEESDENAEQIAPTEPVEPTPPTEPVDPAEPSEEQPSEPDANKEQLEEMKLVLRITSDAFNSEIEMLIEAAKADMRRVGIDESYIEERPPLVRHAIACYVKANFGYDEQDAARFDTSYRQLVCDLLHSKHNIAAIKQAQQESPEKPAAPDEVLEDE